MTDDNAQCVKLEPTEPFAEMGADAGGAGAEIDVETPGASIGVFGVPEGLGGEAAVAAPVAPLAQAPEDLSGMAGTIEEASEGTGDAVNVTVGAKTMNFPAVGEVGFTKGVSARTVSDLGFGVDAGDVTSPALAVAPIAGGASAEFAAPAPPVMADPSAAIVAGAGGVEEVSEDGEDAEEEEGSRPVKRRKSRSAVWQHFEKLSEHTLCLECVRQGVPAPKKFSGNTGVSSLTYHLKARHGIGGTVPVKTAVKVKREQRTEKRRLVVLEVGSGADLIGENVSEAACRACRSAVEFNSLPVLKRLCDGGDLMNMLVRVKLGVPQGYIKLVDVAKVKACFPYGDKEVEIVPGGLLAHTESEGEEKTLALVVVAAVEVHC